MKLHAYKFTMVIAFTIGTALLATLAPALAQTTRSKSSGNEKPRSEEGDEAVEGSVTLGKDATGKFRFYIKNGKEKVIAMSTVSYENQEDAIVVINDIKTLLNTHQPTVVME